MFSPAGQAWLHGGRRWTYSGRSSRQEPVLFARLEPTSSVIANGLSISDAALRRSRSSPKRRMLRSAPAWMRAIDLGPRLGLEQVREALLRAQVVLDGYLPADLRDAGHLAVACLEHREDARLLCQAGDPDRVLRRAAPAERAGDEDVQVARAADLHRGLDLRLEVAQLGDGGGRDVGDLVRHRDQRRALALAEHVPRLRSDGLRGGRARGGRRGARALHAGVHVRLVVVTDVEHVIVALEHPRQARHPDVHGAAVAALADDAHILAALRPQRCGDPGRYGGGVAEQRVDPRDPPGGLRVGGRENLQAAGRVCGDHLPVGGAHRGV